MKLQTKPKGFNLKDPKMKLKKDLNGKAELISKKEKLSEQKHKSGKKKKVASNGKTKKLAIASDLSDMEYEEEDMPTKVVQKLNTKQNGTKLKPEKIKKKGILNGKAEKYKQLHPENDNSDPESDEDISTKVVKKTKKKVKTKGEIKDHKKELELLKDLDPEFYTFLKKNDKMLLDFNLDESDDDTKDDQNVNEDEEELVHKPNENLEAASDESDFHPSDDEDEEKDTSKVVTLKLLGTWQNKLQANNVSIEIIRNVIQAFSSALESISGQTSKISVYQVEGSAAFNGVIQLAVLYLQPAIYKFLGLSPKSKMAIHKCKKWKKIQSSLRSYLSDVSKLIENVSSTNILNVMLKHLHQIGSMVSSFTAITKPILKRLIVLWSTSDDTVRVLSFLCILKITRDQQVTLLNHVLKSMYLAYVRNSKFVSPQTLPSINFMRRSLIEMFGLDLNITYQHAFLYIRQLAIHLRNAIILKKKDSYQAVYNWQFINSIRLWSELLGSTCNKQQLQPLIYPLVNITIGVIKLIPTAQYFPLRFHCIQSLITLSKQTNIFIPILPFILEVLNSNTFNKKHTTVSMKPMQFTFILRLNKSQLSENGFRDEVIEHVFGLSLEYLSYESCSLAFPDLIVPTIFMLKEYLKKGKVSSYTRKMKQLVDKILDNSKFIEDERQKINFTLKDINLIQSWESSIRNKGTPLDLYYNSWIKINTIKRKRQAANTDDINKYDIPMIKRRKTKEQDDDNSSDDGGPVDLFPSDDENEMLELEKPIEKVKKTKKDKLQKKPIEKVQEEVEDEDDFVDDGVDIVKDLDLDDW